MKLVIAVIEPCKLDDVRAAVQAFDAYGPSPVAQYD